MRSSDLIEKIRRKFERVSGVLNERGRRVWAAAEAEALGYGGHSLVANATGLSRVTLHREGIESGEDPFSRYPSHPDRMRKRGGGRKKRTQHEPDLLLALEALVEPTPRGDPESPLRWTCRRTRPLAAALAAQGYRLSHQTVAAVLDDLGYRRQRHHKPKEGAAPPARDAQVRYLHGRGEALQRRGQ